MRWLINSLLTLFVMVLLTAFTAVDRPLVYVEELAQERGVDSLSHARRHSEAVKSINIWRDTLKAQSIWRGIIAEDSLYGPALYNLSKLEPSKSPEALRLSRLAYEADSTNKFYAESYGLALLDNHDYTTALGVYKRLMAMDSRQPSTYYFLAQMYAMQGMPYSAIAVLDSADMRLGRNPVLSNVKQRLLLEQKLFDKAIDEGKRLVADAPYDVEAYLSLANSYEAAERDSLARATFEAAYRLDTTNLDTTVALFEYYVRQNDVERVFDLEEQLFNDERQGVDTKLKHVEAYVGDEQFYAGNYFRIGRLISTLALKYPTNRRVVQLYTLHLCYGAQRDEGMNYLMRHLEDDNVESSDYLFAYQLAEVLKRDELMQNIVDMAVERFPDDIDVVRMAAYLCDTKEDYKGAIKIYRKALKSVTDDHMASSLWQAIGDVYHKMGNNKSAFKAYEKSLKFNPENALTLNNYAYFMALDNGDLERALAMSQLAITLKEGDYDYLDTYAWILHLMGRNVEAKKYMMQALALNRQESPSLLVHYGDILWDLGEKFMAETYWKKAIDKGYDADELREHVLPRLVEDEFSTED